MGNQIVIHDQNFNKAIKSQSANNIMAKDWAYQFICRTLITLTIRYRTDREFEDALNAAMQRCEVPLDLRHHFKSVVGKYFSLQAEDARKRKALGR